MRCKRVFGISFVLILMGATCAAQVPANNADEAAIRAIVTRFEAAWSKCDATALASLWTEDGDFHSPYDLAAKGRAEIEKFYGGAFSEGYCGSRASGAIDRIRFVRDDVAVIDGTWGIEGAHDQNKHEQPPEKGLFTVVARKQGGRWWIVALREMIPANPSGS